MMGGTIHGVGLGPGARDLMSVRADRLIRDARHIAYFRKKGRPGHARGIVEGMLHPDAVEFAMEYPRSEEHTSELQSLMRISYAVFCLQNKNKNTHTQQFHTEHNTNYTPTHKI